MNYTSLAASEELTLERRREAKGGVERGQEGSGEAESGHEQKVTSVKEKKDEGHLELISNNYVVDNETVMMMEGSYRVR